ncbi:MAG TPA: dihydropteroate synthase [Thermoanaerobaculia bacterium]|nr:dihydropteroate synthase [Thermoanaerobaculia bacterium]
MTLQLPHGRTLPLGRFPAVMAILNVTPDSFSDGGLLSDAKAAVEAGLRAADAGAAIVDVGGESTRPRGKTYGEGARAVGAEEELSRVLPVVRGLRAARPSLPISVDTRKAAVARAALDEGADAINVVTGLDVDPELLSLVARHGAALVLNHCRGTPETTFTVSRFADVVADVGADLTAARERAVAAGVPVDRIVVDPGFGFGKSPAESYALLAHLADLEPSAAPLLVGASRKGFLDVAGVPAKDRLPESLAAVALAARAAAHRPVIVRVHDAAETVRFLRVLAKGAS